ncbi:MAG: 30S ribosomal protein S8e [Thermoprotei archaeon]
MSYYQGPDRRKPSGGLKGRQRKKRAYELKRPFHPCVALAEKEAFVVERVRGGNKKVRAKYVSFINVYDPSAKKVRKEKIVAVEKTPSHAEYARSNIITKGSYVRTESGLVVITSRVGQHGVVNGRLIEQEKSS